MAKNPLYVQFGRNLVKIRTRLKWTQAQAAERSGVSFRFYQDMEAGISAPSLPTLASLVRGMRTDFGRLLDGCDRIPEETPAEPPPSASPGPPPGLF
ncbi:MAG TPA: helix-turn-helix transcriptional regulator [Candidatus Methylacidiphilales bacterium]